jgi:hypothetical protein
MLVISTLWMLRQVDGKKKKKKWREGERETKRKKGKNGIRVHKRGWDIPEQNLVPW